MEKGTEYIELLETALSDVLDGESAWYEIQCNTGLSEERCREIEKLFDSLVNFGIRIRGK